jgi:membrane-associated protease RseP (regulator of RpoE activity)
MRPSTALALCLVLVPTVPALAGDSHDPVRIQVQPSANGSDNMVFVTSAQGDPHVVKLESKDGRIVVDAEPDSTRPWLGVLIAPADGGVKVTSVAKDSAADRAGLRRGDVITAVDGKAVVPGRNILDGLKPGERIRIDARRDDRVEHLDARLTGHPGHVEFEDAAGIGAFDFAGGVWPGLEGLKNLPCMPMNGKDCPGFFYQLSTGNGPRLGVVVEPLSDQLARYFGAPAGRGLLVKEVIEKMPASRAGLEAGDVIVRVAGKDIHEPGDIASALEGKDAGEVIVVEVLRRGDSRTFDLTLEDPPKQGWLDATEATQIARVQNLDELRAQAELMAVPRVDTDELLEAVEEVRRAQGSLSVANRSQIEREIEAARAQAGPQLARATEDAEAATEALSGVQDQLAAVQEQLARERAEADAVVGVSY